MIPVWTIKICFFGWNYIISHLTELLFYIKTVGYTSNKSSFHKHTSYQQVVYKNYQSKNKWRYEKSHQPKETSIHIRNIAGIKTHFFPFKSFQTPLSQAHLDQGRIKRSRWTLENMSGKNCLFEIYRVIVITNCPDCSHLKKIVCSKFTEEKKEDISRLNSATIILPI